VVAPITRAVDDKVAHNLLGSSFKRQLQFDGAYSRIAVICSKADDLSVTEVLKAIPEDSEARRLFAHTELLEASRDELQAEVDTMKQRGVKINDEIEQCMTEIECLKSALRGARDGDDIILFSPRSSRKRPSREAAAQARKRLRSLNESDSEDTGFTLEDEPVASEAEREEERVSMETVNQRLQEAEARLTALRTASKDLRQKGGPKEKDLRELKIEIRSLKAQTKSACVKYRNEYARLAIQRQFAEGIRE
jgi:hypothetical protein